MWPFFLISSMVLGLLNQLLIFSQLYLIELLGLLTGLGLLELWHLIYPRLLTGFGMLVFFTNLSLMKFQVRYLTLFLLFSVIGGCTWFWMGSLYKGILLILDFLQAPFLAGVKVMLSHWIWLSVFATWLLINFLNFKLCLVILGTKNWKLFSSFLGCKVGCNFSTK